MYASLYYREMSRFIQDRYVVNAPNGESSPHEWYLPHFGVLNQKKPGKIRLVFDAAAKTNGVCLNDQLEAGPNLLQSLPGVLVRFRQHAVAVKADIKDMFLRVQVRESDRGAQRFLWRGDRRQGEPETYEMTSLIFGAKSPPCSAIYIKDRNAARYAQSKPVAAKSIVKNSYMDDFLASLHTVKEVVDLSRDVSQINAKANFLMHGRASNDSRVFDPAITEEAQNEPQRTKLYDGDNERVLGLRWDRDSDTLGFNVGFSKIPNKSLDGSVRPTKCEFIRIIVSIFDPLGLLSPFTFGAKLLMQDVWRSGVG